MPQQAAILVTLRITPKNLVTQFEHSQPIQRTFIFKFGSTECRSQGLQLPTEITLRAMFSTSTNLFYPIKGIIKVFEVDENGNQIMAAVGASNIDQLPTQNNEKLALKFNVGQNILEAEIETIDWKLENPDLSPPSKKLRKNKSEQNLAEINNRNPFNKEKRISEHDCQEIPYLIDDSDDKIQKFEDISASYCSEFSEDIKQDQRNYLGEQLVEQRRKFRAIEQKLEKSNLKNITIKKLLQNKRNQIKSFIENFKKFTNSLQSDHKGQYIFQLNEKKRIVSMKYKENSSFDRNFSEFLNFMAKKIKERQNLGSSERFSDNENEFSHDCSDYFEESDSGEKIKRIASEKSQLKSQLFDKIKLLQEKQSLNHKLANKIKRYEQDLKSLQGMNQYLQEKDKQMENIINIKENTIENLKKMIDDNNLDIEAMQQKNSALQSSINNLELLIEENKQQIYNLNEVIEGYRKKYGDLKIVKNKAIQMEIKECLRWIDLQANKEAEMGVLDPDLCEEGYEVNGVSSLVKKIDELDNLTENDITSIRRQVVNVLDKLDRLLAKHR